MTTWQAEVLARLEADRPTGDDGPSGGEDFSTRESSGAVRCGLPESVLSRLPGEDCATYGRDEFELLTMLRLILGAARIRTRCASCRRLVLRDPSNYAAGHHYCSRCRWSTAPQLSDEAVAVVYNCRRLWFRRRGSAKLLARLYRVLPVTIYEIWSGRGYNRVTNHLPVAERGSAVHR